MDAKEFIRKYPDYSKRVLLYYINSPKSKISTKYINTYLKIFNLYFVNQKSIKEISDELSLKYQKYYL